MASLYISYLSSVRQGMIGGVIVSETVTTSSSSAAGGAIPAGATAVQLVASADSWATIGGGTPTASATNGVMLPANLPVHVSLADYQGIAGGAALKVAARTVA